MYVHQHIEACTINETQNLENGECKNGKKSMDFSCEYDFIRIII